MEIDERREQMAILSEADRKERLSVAWLGAMAAMAGFASGPPEPDRDSIDLTLSAGGPGRPKMDVQLKATSTPMVREDGLHYELKRKNYDDLREADRMVPLILVVVQLPPNEAGWIDFSNERMVLRRKAWWASLKGAEGIEGKSKTVVLPTDQRLDVKELIELMGRARDRTL
ncbi:MAG: DUF4365 domain-containing protein [Gammaproteobacteria bacterium]|nr:DUF4365 domain-containing protein [Gammaproteobacteria bacterium]